MAALDMLFQIGLSRREVLALAELNDRRTPAEVAAIFGVSAGAIRVREHRARQKLKAAGLHLPSPRRHRRTNALSQIARNPVSESLGCF